VILGRVARAQALPLSGFEKPEIRRIFAPVALGSRNVAPLVKVALEKTPARLEAIALLGLSTTPEAIAVLTSLSARGSKEPEDVRKSAYRALRRAQRRLAKEARP
jgi:hypothetical protein